MSNGEIIVTGSTASTTGDEEILFLRISATGTILASKKLSLAGSEYGRTIMPVSNSTCIIVGYTSAFGSGLNDILLTKIDANENILVCKALGVAANDFGESLYTMMAGFFYIGGYIRDCSTSYDGIIIKIESNLIVNWSKKIRTNTQDDLIASVSGCSDGNILFSGPFKTSVFYNVWFGKVSPTGCILFSKSFGVTADDYGTNIIEDHTGDILVKGQTNSFGYRASDAYLIKLNGSGTSYIWSRAYGGSGSESGMSEANSLFESYDGGYVFLCTSASYSIGSQILVMKSTVSGTNCIVTSQTGAPADYTVSINPFALTPTSASPSFITGYTTILHTLTDSTLCETATGIEANLPVQRIVIFPSVLIANEILNINNLCNNGICKICSSEGQLIAQFDVNTRNTIFSPKLSAGSYLLIYSNGNEETHRSIISP